LLSRASKMVWLKSMAMSLLPKAVGAFCSVARLFGVCVKERLDSSDSIIIIVGELCCGMALSPWENRERNNADRPSRWFAAHVMQRCLVPFTERTKSSQRPDQIAKWS
jgi:hypothetical protein